MNQTDRENSDAGEQTRTQRPSSEDEVGRIDGRLSELIEHRGLRAFAERADLSEGTLRNILKGGIPKLDSVVKIARAAGVSIAWLVGEGGIDGAPGSQEATQAPSNKARRGVEPLQIRNAVILVERRLHKDPDLHSKARTIAEVAQELQYFHDQEWGTED